MKSFTLGATCLVAIFGLSACGKTSSEADVANQTKAVSRDVAADSSGSGAPKAVLEATRCWGLIQGAVVLSIAAPELAAQMPAATEDQKMAWFNEAQRRAATAGMTVKKFQALLDKNGMSGRFAMSADVRKDSVEPLKACLATVPTDTSEPPSLAQG